LQQNHILSLTQPYWFLKQTPNYGERYFYGECISTAFVESAVNQIISKRFVKKQQMRWTKRGAHLLLQMRTKVLNEELLSVFQKWYPDMKSTTEELDMVP